MLHPPESSTFAALTTNRRGSFPEAHMTVIYAIAAAFVIALLMAGMGAIGVGIENLEQMDTDRL
jgi:hypothetical protein